MISDLIRKFYILNNVIPDKHAAIEFIKSQNLDIIAKSGKVRETVVGGAQDSDMYDAHASMHDDTYAGAAPKKESWFSYPLA